MNIKFLRLPGSYNYKSTIARPIDLKTIEFHLGPTFYTRISNIYINTIEAIAAQNYSYLASAMSQPLSTYLITKRNDLKDNGYRVRIHRPNKIVIPKKNNKRDKLWKSENASIGIESSVYFGMQFDPSNPINAGKSYFTIQTGPHRYFTFNRSLSVFQNIANLFKYQTYEFKTKILSTTHMKVFDSSNKSIILDDEKDEFQQKGLENPQKQVQTQFLLRTGNKQFDWIIVDINGIMANRSKV